MLPDGTRDKTLQLQLIHAIDADDPPPTAVARATLIFSPPKTADTRAGIYPVSISVTSRGEDRITRAVQANFTVLPFTGLDLKIEPPERRGRKGVYMVELVNGANTDVTVDVRAESSAKMSFNPEVQQIRLGNGATRQVPLTVRPKRRWWGTGHW